jgi:hypothetical protein
MRKISICTLLKLNLAHTTVISLKEFEDQELLNIKPTRSAAEYCWTCTPATILYCIRTFKLDSCTYIDADLLFFSDPAVLIEEMGTDSVLIIAHRYTPEYDQTTNSGKYCVQFMTFRNDARGMKVLTWWKDRCIEWCYARFEDGKFGDQKYLDDWTTRFEGVHELKHIGGGVAPWNLQQYTIRKKNEKLFVQEGTAKEVELVFFHFHYIKFFLHDIVRITSHYDISRQFVMLVYWPYLTKLKRLSQKVFTMDPSFDSNGASEISTNVPFSFKDKLHLYKAAVMTFDVKEMGSVQAKIDNHYYFYLSSIK